MDILNTLPPTKGCTVCHCGHLLNVWDKIPNTLGGRLITIECKCPPPPERIDLLSGLSSELKAKSVHQIEEYMKHEQ